MGWVSVSKDVVKSGMGRWNRWHPGWLRLMLVLGAMCVSLALSASLARALVGLSSADLTGWTAVTPANGQHDYLTDQQTASGQSVPQDIVGDNVYRSAYVKYDDNGTPDVSDDWLAFRMRVNNTNSTSPVSSGFDKFGFFGVDHGLDGDIDFFVGVYNPSHSSQGKIGVYDANGAGNTGPSDTGIAGSSSVTYNSGTTNWSSMWSFVQATDGSNFSGQADYFISFQVKVADINANKATFGIASDITKDTTLRYIVGTAAQDNAFNQDISGMQGWSSSGTWASLGVFTPVVNTDGSVPAGVTVVESGGSTGVTEGGATDTYTVVLTTQPSSNVTVNVYGDSQVNVSPAALTFTGSNWNTPQTVTVTAVDDATAEGAHAGTVTHAVYSSDTAYNGISVASVTVNITDNDSAGVSVVESGGSTRVTEGGATDTYTVVLTIQPAANVTVSVYGDSQVNVSPATLTFTNSNWATSQTVTVTAVDDATAEGAHTGTVTHAVYSSDTNYNGISVASVTVNITDNDVDPGKSTVTASPTSVVADGTTTSTVTVTLRDAYGGPVSGKTVTLAAGSGSSTITTVSGTTNASGVATFTVKDTVAEAVTYTATDTTDSVTVTQTATVTFTAGTPPSPPAPPPPPPPAKAFLYGSVIDHKTGKPVAGAQVSVSEDLDGNGVPDYTVTVTTGADGSYQLPVPRGDWLYKMDIGSPVRIGDSTVILPSTQYSSVGSLSETGGRIAARKAIGGLLLVAGSEGPRSVAPLISSGTRVSAELRSLSGDAVSRPVTVSPTGAFLVDDVGIGDYAIAFRITAPDGQQLVGPSVNVAVRQDGEMVLQTALIDPFGIVTDADDGRPVAGVTMGLYWADTPLNRAAGRTPGALVALPALPDFPPNQNAVPQLTTAAGEYAWLVFPDADYYIRATKDGYLPYDSRQDGRTVPAAPGSDSYVQNGIIHVGGTVVEFDLRLHPTAGQHRRYIRGYPDGTFKPGRSVSRAEVATILARIEDLAVEDRQVPYPDVPPSHWAVGHIGAVLRAGLMVGYPDGRFRPDDPISRAEVAVLTARYRSLGGQTGSSFRDVAGHWARGSIEAAHLAGILHGFPDGRFRPDERASRAEFVTLINHMLGRGPLAGRPAPRWPDVLFTHWGSGAVEEASYGHTYFRPTDGGERWVGDVYNLIR